MGTISRSRNQASRKRESQFYSHKELNSGTNLNVPRGRFLSRIFREEHSLNSNLISAVKDPEQRTSPASTRALFYRTRS